MESILIDAGPIIALFDKDDRFHDQIKEFLKNNHYTLITTWAVATEVCHMLDFSVQAQVAFLEWTERGAVEIVDIKPSSLKRLIELTKKYHDVPMDLADGSLIILAEIRNIKKIITIDSDYYVYRTIRNEYLENIFEIVK